MFATLARSSATALSCVAIAGSLPVPAHATARMPSTASVTKKVERKFRAQYDDDGAEAKCRKAGTASWSCEVHTTDDQLRVSEAIASGDGSSSAERAKWYSYACTARYSAGKVSVGSFREHNYDH